MENLVHKMKITPLIVIFFAVFPTVCTAISSTGVDKPYGDLVNCCGQPPAPQD